MRIRVQADVDYPEMSRRRIKFISKPQRLPYMRSAKGLQSAKGLWWEVIGLGDRHYAYPPSQVRRLEGRSGNSFPLHLCPRLPLTPPHMGEGNSR